MLITRRTYTTTTETETERTRNQVVCWSVFGIPVYSKVDEVWRKGSTISNELRIRVMDADNHTCVYCGAVQDLTIDHRIPQVQGGLTIESNLLTACRSCNSRKNGRTPEEADMLPCFGRFWLLLFDTGKETPSCQKQGNPWLILGMLLLFAVLSVSLVTIIIIG